MMLFQLPYERFKATLNGKIKTICHGVMCAFDMATQQSVLVSQKWRDKINKFELGSAN